MPVSKKRTAKKHLVRKPLTLTKEKTERWNIKLNGSRLAFLRDNPDFMTMIKIGRAMNAVLYAMQTVLDNREPKTIVQTRQYRRGCFVLAGYLHQGIRLIPTIQRPYLKFPEFQMLREVAHDPGTKAARVYVKKVRNFTAFHLDEYNETTQRTLAKLKPTMYILASGDNQAIGNFYFDLADEVDLQFLLAELSNETYGEVTPEDLFGTIFGLAQAFLEACSTFNAALFAKIKLSEHVYRGTH